MIGPQWKVLCQALRFRQALDEAATETAQTTPRGGLFAMLALLSKPEAQRSLAFLRAFSEKFQRGVTGP